MDGLLQQKATEDYLAKGRALYAEVMLRLGGENAEVDESMIAEQCGGPSQLSEGPPPTDIPSKRMAQCKSPMLA